MITCAWADNNIRLAPGDDKTGYESETYTTDSLSLVQRIGQPSNLLQNAQREHLGLPPLDAKRNLSPNRLQIQLGRKLFYDRRLSRNQTMSCAMCHIPEQGFTNNELARPIGFEGRSIKRNAPTILNIAFAKTLFADGREDLLEQQVWAPLLASNEMNNPSVGAVVNQLKEDQQYRKLFAEAFGQAPNMLNIGLAFAQYEQSLIAGDSAFDRWYFAGRTTALNPQQKLGFALFTGKAQCNRCHLIDEQSALFTDHQLHNTGVGFADSMLTPDTVTVQLAPGISTELDTEVLATVGDPKENDLGRYEVTLDPADRWKFRTPSLRNVAITAPYMHNGQFQTLLDVVQLYNRGGVEHELLSPLIMPLELTQEEENALVEFMLTLTGSNVAELVADAFAADVGDPSTDD